ncbi:MAG: hypothetical protein A2Y25_10090 [Candidatus Melainabacteria bacterium GWF2_37_15]|nr:MAG: hypothetical protein A2Y25_10090 [Candidatus Melainabacteria bacterium GWF2_37_15]
MTEKNFKTFLSGVRNDLKIAVDDLFNAIEIVYEDVEHLKVKMSKPDKLAASLLLDYLGWEEGQSKQNLEKICGEEIRQYMKWLEYYCQKEGGD